MKNKIIRGILALVLVGIILFAGFIALIVAALEGKDFYIYLILIVAMLLIAWIIIAVFRLLRSKIVWLSLLGIVLCAVAAASIYEGHENYIAGIPVIDDQGVNLYDYQPFAEESKVAKLNEKPTLSFTDSLPVIDGATALYPLYAAFVQATYPEGEYNPYGSNDSTDEDFIINGSIVSCHTTLQAYANLLNGNADLIFCAAPSKSQVEAAAAKGKKFNLTPIGREAFVFFVNAENPVSELTIEQIQDIYSGKITNWCELGGNDEDIKAFQRPAGSGSQTMLEKIMENRPLMNPPENDVASGMGDIIKQTAEYKNFGNAIGYTFLFFATEMVGNNQIKLIKVNGVYPDKNAIKNNTYPYVDDFYAVTAGTDNKNVTTFVNWILSEQGQYLVGKTGYIPIRKINDLSGNNRISIQSTSCIPESWRYCIQGRVG